MKRKIKALYIIAIIIVLCTNSYIYSNDDVAESVKDEVSTVYEFDKYVETLNKYVKSESTEDFDLESMAVGLINGDNIKPQNIISKLIGIFSKELLSAIRSGIIIYIIVVVMAIISSLELDKGSDITKLSHLVCFLAISTFTITTFIDVISLFKNVIGTLTTAVQVISPFMMCILIATGAITTTGIIEPLLLFLASAIGFAINYIVIPFFSISVAFNVICSISDNLRLSKMSKMFPSIALTITTVALTFFLGVLSLETNLTTSVDSLAVKTTQTAVSNFVPVVGKFFSDSFETVVGATQIIGKVGGTLGIICIIVVAITPIIKIACIMGIYTLIGALTEPILANDNVIKYISGFAELYKTLLGILIGVVILFVISTGIILNLVGSVVK